MEQKTKTDWLLFTLSIFVVCSIVGYAIYLLKSPDITSSPFAITARKNIKTSKKTATVIQGQIYKNSEFGFSFVFPSNWTSKDTSDGDVSLSNQAGCVTGGACMGNIITVKPVRVALDMPISGYIASLPKSNFSKRNVPVHIDGAEAMSLSYGIEGESDQVREYYIKPEGKDYIIVVFQEGYPDEAKSLVNSLTY